MQPFAELSGAIDAFAETHTRDRRSQFSMALQQVLFVVLPVFVTVSSLHNALRGRWLASDFRYVYWVAGRHLLDGTSPYVSIAAQVRSQVAFAYPAVTAMLFAPFALVSRSVIEIPFLLACMAMVPLTIWVLGVRDWRVYGIAMLWGPVSAGWHTANLTLPIMLLIAIIWRYRDERPRLTGVLVALAVSLKPFAWPLVLWLIATRRWRASLSGLVCGVAINAVAWTLLGYRTIGQFLQITSRVTAHHWKQGYGVRALAMHLGFSDGFGSAAQIALTGVLIVAVLLAARDRGLELRTIALTIGLMLVASPLVWSHYFALLLIPIALRRQRLSLIWLLPVAMWVCPISRWLVTWQVVLAWVIAGASLTALSLGRDQGARALRTWRISGLRPLRGPVLLVRGVEGNDRT